MYYIVLKEPEDVKQRWNICKETLKAMAKTDHPHKYGFASNYKSGF